MLTQSYLFFRYWLLGCFNGNEGFGSFNLVNNFKSTKPQPEDCP